MDRESRESPPYGPAANLKSVFETWRNRSMPEMVGKEWLERIGISANLTVKNLHALRFLGLIDDAGYTTVAAQRLRTATSEEYPAVLEEIIRKAYKRVFEVRNPSVDSRTRIDDAFRHEMPQAQRSRMVACFLGLCILAGIPVKEAPPVRDSQARRATTSVSKKQRDPSPPEEPNQTDEALRTAREAPRARGAVFLDPILGGLLKTAEGLESADELDEWYQVFRAAFVFVRNMNAKNRNEAGL